MLNSTARLTATRLITAAVVVLLTACSSTPDSQYYLLTALAQGESENESPSVGVGPIEIPQYLNRNGLVYHRAGNQVDVASFERWAEPLTDGLSRVISLNLSALLNSQSVQVFPWPQQYAPTYAVSVNVLELDAEGTQASLAAKWTIRHTKGEIITRRLSRLSESLKGSDSAASITAAYSRLLLSLSEEIAAGITAATAESNQ
ncbi:MAG: PqiC family protein [Halioglobus sp.]